MTPNILAGVAALITFVFVFYLLRRGVLREKYAVLWLFFSGAALFFAIFPSALEWISALIGVAAPVNLLFFTTVLLLVLVSVQLSYELSRHEMRIRRLAEEVALLQEQIDNIKDVIVRLQPLEATLAEYFDTYGEEATNGITRKEVMITMIITSFHVISFITSSPYSSA